MVSLIRLESRGSSVTAIFDDGTRVLCVAGAGSKLYYPRPNEFVTEEPPVDPPDTGTSEYRWPFPLSAITGGVGGVNDFGSNYGGPSTARPSHTGIDFGMPPAVAGAPNRAIGPGVVSFADFSNFGGGWEIQVQHNIGGTVYTSFYSHGGTAQYSTFQVGVGDTVTGGQHLSNIGSTGNSTGAHQHLAIHTGFSGGVAQWTSPTNFMNAMNPNGEVW